MKHKRKKPASTIEELANRRVIRKIVRDELRLITQTNQEYQKKQFLEYVSDCLLDAFKSPLSSL